MTLTSMAAPIATSMATSMATMPGPKEKLEGVKETWTFFDQSGALEKDDGDFSGCSEANKNYLKKVCGGQFWEENKDRNCTASVWSNSTMGTTTEYEFFDPKNNGFGDPSDPSSWVMIGQGKAGTFQGALDSSRRSYDHSVFKIADQYCRTYGADVNHSKAGKMEKFTIDFKEINGSVTIKFTEDEGNETWTLVTRPTPSPTDLGQNLTGVIEYSEGDDDTTSGLSKEGIVVIAAGVAVGLGLAVAAKKMHMFFKGSSDEATEEEMVTPEQLEEGEKALDSLRTLPEDRNPLSIEEVAKMLI